MDYQTKTIIAEYMASLVPEYAIVLEPTPGEGNLVKALKNRECGVFAPPDYFKVREELLKKEFDYVVMNPPFSDKSCNLELAPKDWKKSGMKVGYRFLLDAMSLSDNIIALMPWFTLIDSDVRTRKIKEFGLKQLTALPRSSFDYIRIQCCIMVLEKGYKGETQYNVMDIRNNVLKIL